MISNHEFVVVRLDSGLVGPDGSPIRRSKPLPVHIHFDFDDQPTPHFDITKVEPRECSGWVDNWLRGDPGRPKLLAQWAIRERSLKE